METTVPRLSAAEAVALAVSLSSAHHTSGKGRDARLDARLSEVVAKQKALSAVLSQAPEPASEKKKYDLRCDAAWRATNYWLTGWTLLADPLAESAKRLMQCLFADGLDFINATFDAQWAEQDRRLAALKNSQLEPLFTTLGGAAFLTELHASHREYGKALNITQASNTLPQPSLTTPLRSLAEAIGNYLVALAAFASDGPEAASIANVLAAPVERFRTPRTTPVAPLPVNPLAPPTTGPTLPTA
jgi:hypothetical protein